MFEKNDKALLTARIIINVIIGIFALLSLVMGIVLAVLVYWALFLTAVAGWLLCWIMWIFSSLYLSYLCDIKLIRNKLYGEDNDGLEAFLNTYKNEVKSVSATKEKTADIEIDVETDLKSIKQLLDEGLISEEQYKNWEDEIRSGK